MRGGGCTRGILPPQVFQDPEWAGMEEECGVEAARIRPLYAFESRSITGGEPSSEDGPSALKDQGNELFGCGDYAAAFERYNYALLRLAQPVQTGMCV
jgi:hypothetical protein